jgi:alginate O-acetyltransferase complex protein AlgI
VIFTEPRFLVFFLVVLGVHWSLRGHRARKLWLLFASCAFYAAWDWRFLGLLLVSAAVDLGVGHALGRTAAPRARKALLATSLAVNLGLLGCFKYFDFFVESGARLLAWMGLPASPHVLGLVLPVGISFYTFQTLSYTLDVYRRRIAPVASALDFALFVAFFPQLVAGPIVRASELLPQLAEPRSFARVDVRAALVLFLIGWVKKAVLSDHVAPAIAPVFADPGAFSASSTWIALCLYHVQIYCDFSGYSDMAIATAALLGYTLPRNFAFPYFARSLGAFWQRWHISLSTWFRDYLYFPLGGSRGGGARGVLAGALTMLVVGLWHGAGWQYVGFGVLMGGALVVARLWERCVPEGTLARRAVHALGTPILWLFLFWNWILFRSTGWEPAWEMQRIFCFAQAGGERQLEPAWLALVVAFFAVHLAFYRGWFRRVARVNDWLFAAAVGAAAAGVLAVAAVDTKAFIYFRF